MKLKVEKVTQSMRVFTLLLTSSEASAISTALWKTTLKACNQKKDDLFQYKLKDKPSLNEERLRVGGISGYLQTELIHGVDLVQVIHDKVKQGRPDGYGTIVLPGFVYLHLIHFSFQHLRTEDPKLKIKRKEMSDDSSGYLQLNLRCCVFGGLQFLHQQVVAQEVALSRRQPGQELVFQKLELNLEHVLLFGQFALHRFKSVIGKRTENCHIRERKRI